MKNPPPIVENMKTKDGLPVSFRWQGQTHTIDEIVRNWRLDEGWWIPDNHVIRMYWQVTTETGWLLELFEDLKNGGWYVGRIYD